MRCPLVSIVIPVYNGTLYMREAIDSALAQTYPNVEVIVVNDGSTDSGETERIALSYGDRIRYYSKENGGVSSALNYGIRQMKGEYFSWLSHDDVYSPDKIKHQIDLLLPYQNPNLIALCGMRQINANSEFLKRGCKDRFKTKLISWSEVLKDLLQNGAFNGCSFLIPKSVFAKVGYFHENLRYSQDALMWMQIFSEKYDLLYDKSPDVFSRVHGGQLTQTGRTMFLKDSLAIGEIMIPKLAALSKSANDFLYAFAYRSAVHGNKELVVNCIKASHTYLAFSMQKKLSLRVILMYGRIRPALRKCYYRYVRKVSV